MIHIEGKDFTLCGRYAKDGLPPGESLCVYAVDANCQRCLEMFMESRGAASAEEDDPVNHPKHYTVHPSGIECIQVVEHYTFNLGNAIKYIWRAGWKDDAVQDLKKAAWYIQREIERLEK